MPRKQADDNVAFRDGTVATEVLPHPIVHYPGHYGAFFGFQETSDSVCFLCSCSRPAVEHYIELRHKFPDVTQGIAAKRYLIGSGTFPIQIVNRLIEDDVPETTDVVHALHFKKGLCHRCNNQTPTLRYCVPMYGGTFMQQYGWYVKQRSLEYGIIFIPTIWLPEYCPDSILKEITFDPELIYRQATTLLQKGESQSGSEALKPLERIRRRIMKIIENEVREDFGYARIGEAWVTETLLFKLVSEACPQYNVLHHHRPSFLEGQELDIFIEEINIGIEYQGIQHYKAVKHWGGKRALEENKKRDARKKHLCQLNNVKLIYFKYTEEISKELVSNRLMPIIEDISS